MINLSLKPAQIARNDCSFFFVEISVFRGEIVKIVVLFIPASSRPRRPLRSLSHCSETEFTSCFGRIWHCVHSH